jgi:hypothetical protein
MSYTADAPQVTSLVKKGDKALAKAGSFLTYGPAN